MSEPLVSVKQVSKAFEHEGRTLEVLDDRERRERMTRHNFAVARRHFSYRILHRRLAAFMDEYREFLGLNGAGAAPPRPSRQR